MYYIMLHTCLLVPESASKALTVPTLTGGGTKTFSLILNI